MATSSNICRPIDATTIKVVSKPSESKRPSRRGRPVRVLGSKEPLAEEKPRNKISISSLPIPVCDGFPSYLSTPSAKPSPASPFSGMKKYLLSGRFQLMKWLGSGGMADVYLANDLLTRMKVAIKMIRENAGDSETMKELFSMEMRALQRIRHPGVPEFICAGEFNERQYYAMEAIFGLSLDKKLKLQRDWTAENALMLFSMVCRILENVHRQGIIHRDLKPGNIIVPDVTVYHSSVKLVDFGLAKLIGYPSRIKTVIGTYCYLPPERLNARMDDSYGDIYALGLTMYSILGGYRVVNTPLPWYFRIPERLPELEGVHPQMNAIIAKAAELDPEKRWNSASEMGLAIDRFRYEYGNLGWRLP